MNIINWMQKILENEILVGALISLIITLIIAHIYFKKSSKDLSIQIEKLEIENQNLKDMILELRIFVDNLLDESSIIKNHIVHGTIDDPEYPYKY